MGEVLVAGIMGILLYLVRWITNRYAESQAQKEAMQALLEGMAVAQEDIIREAKMAASNGKLTKEQIAAAQDKALDHAKMIVSGPAKAIVLSWSKERAISLIKQLIARVRG